eukprot:scaffold312431_cov22-Tisochrysis_lutea.AAC.4
MSWRQITAYKSRWLLGMQFPSILSETDQRLQGQQAPLVCRRFSILREAARPTSLSVPHPVSEALNSCLCQQCLAVFAPRLSKYVPPGGHWDVGSLCILPYLCGKVDIEMSAAFVYFLISVVRGQAGMLACKCSELCSAKVCAGPGSCVGQLRGKLRAT